MDNQDAGWRTKFAGAALLLAVFGVLWFMVAALGTKFGWWGYEIGLGTMIGNAKAGWGRYMIGLTAIVSVLAIIISLIAAPRKRPLMLSLAAFLVIALLGARWMAFQLNALRLPPVADIQTNWESGRASCREKVEKSVSDHRDGKCNSHDTARYKSNGK